MDSLECKTSIVLYTTHKHTRRFSLYLIDCIFIELLIVICIIYRILRRFFCPEAHISCVTYARRREMASQIGLNLV